MGGMSKWADDPRSDEELVRAALCFYAEQREDDEDDDHSFENPVTVFYYRASARAIALAERLCRSETPLERVVGAEMLNQLVQAVDDGADARSARWLAGMSGTLLAMLQREQETEVLDAVISALGFVKQTERYQPAVVEALLAYYRHPQPVVRRAVVGALWGATDARAVEMLRQLTADADAGVRDWATFGLGAMSDADAPAIREALAARLDDPDATTRGEALVGLARRGDPRALARLLQMPFTPADAHTLQGEALREAGIATGDPRLLPLLERVHDDALREGAERVGEDLSRALHACRHAR